jgi:PAS domain S-box-containing protein
MVSLWVEDISGLRAVIRAWRARGISDLRAYLQSHPVVLRKAVRSIKVVDVNDVTLQLYEAKAKRELLGPLRCDAESIPTALELIMAVAEGRHELESESAALTLKGRKLDILTKTRIRAEGDADPFVLVNVIDISERTRLDRELTEERALLRAVIDNIPDQVFLKDWEGRFLVVNQALALWAGAADSSELVGRSDLDYFPREVAEKFRGDDQAILRSGTARRNIEERISSASGSEGWALTTKAPVRDPAGRVFGLVGIVRDITARKQLEETLRETEERYRAIFMDAPVGIFHSSLEGKLISVNPAYARIMGYDSPEQIVEIVNRKSVAEVIYDDPQSRSDLINALVRDPGWHRIENRQRRRDGGIVVTQLTIRLHIPPGAAEPELEGFVEDITERREAEQALSRERAFLTALMDNIPDYIYFKDRESRFILNNKAHAQEVGAGSSADMLGKTDFDYFAPGLAQKAFDDEQCIIRTGQPLVNALEEETWTDRPSTWVSSTKMPLKDENGEIVGTFGISRDMTERRQMEQKNLRLAAMIESSNDAIIGVDLDDSVMSWNKGAEKIFGFTAEEMVGKPITDLLSPDVPDQEPARMEKLAPQEGVRQFESSVTRKDGTTIHVSTTFSPIQDAHGLVVGITSISRDVTYQRALQTQIIRSQRLESLGTLSAGIAHQFNNINAATQGYLDIMARDTTLPAGAQSYVREALKAVHRAVEITERLQGLTSAATMGGETLRLEEEVPTLLPLIEEKLNAEGISIQIGFQETAPVRATRLMLSFIVTSLLTNSIHALLDCPLRLITIRTRSAAGFSALEVVDTGCGIPAENLPRIFTPFFTTKGEWAEPNSPQSRVKGIGLSLAVCRSTISESGGRIEVESSPNLGSTFRVWFPARVSAGPGPGA